MRRLLRWIGLFALSVLTACNMAVPLVTPTVAASRTPSQTPALTSTPTITESLTATDTLTPTPTPTASNTLTLTPTSTATNTSAPTFTATPTLTPTFTPSNTPTDTPMPSPTVVRFSTSTPTISLTPSPTATITHTPTLTDTATITDTPTHTGTHTQSATFTETPTPTHTLTATATIEPSPTPTLTITLTPSLSPTATIMPTVEPSATSTDNDIQVAASNTAFAGEIVRTLTALAPSQTPTPILSDGEVAATSTAFAESIIRTLTALAPTLDSTPTFITAQPGTDAPALTQTLPPTITLSTGNEAPQGEVPTSTPIAATDAPVPTRGFVVLDPLPTIAGFDPATRSFALSTSGGLRGDVLSLPGGAFTFAQNPVFPNLYARAATNGSLFVVDDIAGGGARVDQSPFSQYDPDSAAVNNARVTAVKWSPDGRYLAFMIDTRSDGSGDNDLANDGMYFFEPGAFPPIPLFRHCPPEPSCALVDRAVGPYQYRTTSFDWNGRSDALLLRLSVTDPAWGSAFAVVSTDSYNASVLPRVYRYDQAAWGNDGRRVLASGGGDDGRVGLRWIDPATGDIELVFDAGVAGLWMQNGVQRPNGQIVALASPNGANSPMQIVNSAGTPLTGFIGEAAPTRVEWSPDRSAVLIVTGESGFNRYFVAEIGGVVEEITGRVAGALAVEWISAPPTRSTSSAPPPAADPAPTPTVIPPITTFVVGQQVRAIINVNLRASPSAINSDRIAVIPQGAVMTIVGDSVAAETLIWWQVEYAGQTGWVAQNDGFRDLLHSVS